MIGGIVLAAGAATVYLDGRPVLEHAIRAQTASPVERVVVVLGAGADDVMAGVDPHGAEFFVCGRWHEGQSASLACGLAQLKDCEAAVVTLGDQPRLSPQAVARAAITRAPRVSTRSARPTGAPSVIPCCWSTACSRACAT